MADRSGVAPPGGDDGGGRCQEYASVTGNGDVLQPADGVIGIGSGGNFAMAAARASLAHSNLSAAEIVRTSLEIAAGIDVFTNTNIMVEELKEG